MRIFPRSRPLLGGGSPRSPGPPRSHHAARFDLFGSSGAADIALSPLSAPRSPLSALLPELPSAATVSEHPICAPMELTVARDCPLLMSTTHSPCGVQLAVVMCTACVVSQAGFVFLPPPADRLAPDHCPHPVTQASPSTHMFSDTTVPAAPPPPPPSCERHCQQWCPLSLPALPALAPPPPLPSPPLPCLSPPRLLYSSLPPCSPLSPAMSPSCASRDVSLLRRRLQRPDRRGNQEVHRAAGRCVS